LPEYLHEHIDVVEPTNSFLRPVKKAPKSTAKFGSYASGKHEDVSETLASQFAAAANGTGPTDCDPALVTPGCLRSLYGTLDYEAKAAGKNRMSIANYLGELNIRSDLKQYLQQFRPEAVAAADEFQLISIDNGTTQESLTADDVENSTGVEGALDVQSMLGIAWPTEMISYSTGGSQPGFKPDNFTPTNTNEPYLVWVQYMLNLGDDEIPYVVSTSYADDEQTVSPDYAKRVCDSFAQLGARGVSIFFSSGDEGVGSTGDCFANDPPYARRFLPEFPSSCPYVTTVGATYLFNPEVAAFDDSFTVPFTSGGGFSDLFPTPDYQKDAIAKYLAANQNFPQYEGLFNPSGRAYPDVAAQGVNYSVIYNSTVIRVDGTSASTPAFAAIIALVNDALLAAGKSTLGFLNPWLYGGGYKAFTDVTSGSAAGCEVEGFPATEGWDAVTGFGTPNFPKILQNLGIGEGGGKGGHHGKRSLPYINRHLPHPSA
jgi:tripeptidyl-peptidase-1